MLNIVIQIIVNLLVSIIEFLMEHMFALDSELHLSCYSAWNDLIDIVTGFLSDDIFDYANVSTVQTEIIEAVRAPAYALAIFFWMYGILKVENTIAEMKRPESVVRHFIRLGIAVWLIEFAPELVQSIWDIGMAIATSVGASGAELGHVTAQGLTGVGEDFYGAFHASSDLLNGEITVDNLILSLTTEYSTEYSIMKLLEVPTALAYLAIILFVLDIACRIAILKCAYNIFTQVISRFFRILLLIFVGPLAVSTAAAEDTQRVVFQYIKNVCAVSIEIGLVAMLLKVFSTVADDIMNDTTIIYSIRDALLSLLYPGVSAIIQILYNINTVFLPVAQMLLFMLCIFILQASIKGMNSIVDSIFGLRGV